MTIFNVDQNRPDPFKINVKQSCEFIAGSWWDVKPQTVHNCWRKAGFKFNDNKGLDSKEIPEDGNNLEENEFDRPTSLEQVFLNYENTMGQKSSGTVNDYLDTENELAVFAEATDEDILAEVTGTVILSTAIIEFYYTRLYHQATDLSLFIYLHLAVYFFRYQYSFGRK